MLGNCCPDSVGAATLLVLVSSFVTVDRLWASVPPIGTVAAGVGDDTEQTRSPVYEAGD